AMTKFQIVSSEGVNLGIYEAKTAEEALDAMARDACYRDAAHAAEVAGAFEGTVTEVEDHKRSLDIEKARQALRDAPEIVLEVTPGGHCGDGRRCDCREGGYGYGGSTARGSGDCYCNCDGCAQGDYYVTARDMRGRAVPYIEEAAAREGVAYIATTIDGDRRKTILGGCATPHKVEAFRGWARSQRMIDFYSDPARGIAWAYEIAAASA